MEGTIEGMCGRRSPLVESEKDEKLEGREAQVCHFRSEQNEASSEHTKSTSEDKKKKIKDKTPRNLGPEDTTVPTRRDCPTLQLCGDSKVACKWIKKNWTGTKDPALVVEKGGRQTDLEH